MRIGVCSAVLAVVAGCASLSTSRYDYAALSAEPTSADWGAGTVWAFTLPERSPRAGTLTYRVTDRPADTCMSGAWYDLDPVADELPKLGKVELKPAYHTSGRHLIVSLNSNVCDLNSEIRGVLAGHLFDGDHSTGDMTGSTL